jgi:hypothetical protein
MTFWQAWRNGSEVGRKENIHTEDIDREAGGDSISATVICCLTDAAMIGEEGFCTLLGKGFEVRSLGCEKIEGGLYLARGGGFGEVRGGFGGEQGGEVGFWEPLRLGATSDSEGDAFLCHQRAGDIAALAGELMAQAEDEDCRGDADGVGDSGGTAGGERVLGARQRILQQGICKQGDERVRAVDEASTRY